LEGGPSPISVRCSLIFIFLFMLTWSIQI
jgi:hypothetical protein